MSQQSKNNMVSRYFCIIILMVVVGISIVVKAAVVMFGERQYWKVVADRFVAFNKPVKATRGNILSADNQLMASSLPEYKVYMDFLAGGKKKDSLLMANLDEISQGMHKIFPGTSKGWFKQHLREGRKGKKRNYLLYPHRISYIQYKELQRLPVFSLSPYKGGFTAVAFNQRKKPFGSLAMRTLGDMYPAKDSARSGLELAFDSLLRGKDGVMHRQKVMNRWLGIMDRPPVDGCDIISTIDVDMQDIAEKALVDKLKEIDATSGVAVLMEVATGDVKAIVNMTKCKDGKYRELRNDAIASMMEPGSTFKTASIMVALEDGYITPNYEVDTGDGVKPMYGRSMKDWNWYKGGYGKINVSRILEVSSNIGVSTIIDHFYHNNPQKFIDGLKRMSLDQPLHLQLPGEGNPVIKGPREKYFAKTTLPWMSIGYETQIPPINILAFYNAIANNGVMVRPRFVTTAMRGNDVVAQYPVEVINPKICSDKTLEQIRGILRKVVSQGLAKPAGSTQFHVSGKTGTAQISQGASGYKAGGVSYLVSFCGYFPSEHPKYSCIVSIRIPHGPASGGLMAGSVFSKIAERVYAKDLTSDLARAADSTSVFVPHVKKGDLKEAQAVLNALQVKNVWNGSGNLQWGSAQSNATFVNMNPRQVQRGVVPDVNGMGAKDAVFLMEKAGLRVKLDGLGHVYEQSLQPGTTAHRGETIELKLRN